MVMQGIYKDNGWWQTQAARKDWDYLARFAKDNGLGHVADEYAPQPLHGWRVIDKQISTLRGILKDNGLDVPPSPSNTVAFTEWERRQKQCKFRCNTIGCDNRPFTIDQSQLDDADGFINCEICDRRCEDVTDIPPTDQQLRRAGMPTIPGLE